MLCWLTIFRFPKPRPPRVTVEATPTERTRKIVLGKRKGRSKTKLSAKERKTLVNDVRKRMYPGIKEEVLHRLDNEIQFTHYPDRLQFLELCKKDPGRTHLFNLLQIMTETYMDLLHKFCPGKKYLEFQNSWFFHLNIYFDVDSVQTVEGITTERAKKLHDSWQLLVENTAVCGKILTIDDQRIFLASMSSIFFDIMSDEIKSEKMEGCSHYSQSDYEASSLHC